MHKMIFLLLFISSFTQAQTVEETNSLIRTIQEANSLCTSSQLSCLRSSARPRPNPRQLNNTSSAANDSRTDQPINADRASYKTSTIQDMHGRALQISVIPESEIQNLTRLYPANLKNMDPEICAHRAHALGAKLAQEGVETVKLLVQPERSLFFPKFIIPDERLRTSSRTTPQWDFHIANLIYVEKPDGRREEYIIDPLMETYPVPRAAWEARLRKNPRSSIGRMNIVSRYVVDDKDTRNLDLFYDQERLTTSTMRLAN